jgi:hypothetical protein
MTISPKISSCVCTKDVFTKPGDSIAMLTRWTLVLAFASSLGATTRFVKPPSSQGLPSGTNPPECDAHGLSEDDPWLSLKEAVGCLNSGDTLILLDGVYHLSETLEVPNKASGTADAYTVIRAKNKWLAKIQNQLPCTPRNQDTEADIGIRLQTDAGPRSGYVEVRDIEFFAGDQTGGIALAVYGHHNKINGNYFHDFLCPADDRVTSAKNVGVAISGQFTDDPKAGSHVEGFNQVVNNVFYNITPQETLPDPASHDGVIKIQSSSAFVANNLLVQNGTSNISLECNATGTDANPVYVINNTIVDARSAGINMFGRNGKNCGSGGGPEGSHLGARRELDYVRIYNNIVTFGGDGQFSMGIYENDVLDTIPDAIGSHNIVKNNLVFATPGKEFFTNVGLTRATVVNSGGTGCILNACGDGGTSSTDWNSTAGATGNKRGDPQFVLNPPLNSNGSFTGGDLVNHYRLKSTSPAIGAGIASDAALVTELLAPNPAALLGFLFGLRPQANGPDMGAVISTVNPVTLIVAPRREIARKRPPR